MLSVQLCRRKRNHCVRLSNTTTIHSTGKACDFYKNLIKELRLRDIYNPFPSTRKLSSAYWFYAELLCKPGSTILIEQAIVNGREQAIKFAEFDASDSKYVLALYHRGCALTGSINFNKKVGRFFLGNWYDNA